MKTNTILTLFIIGFVFASCGAKKNSTAQKTSSVRQNYAYIEKFHEGVRLKTKGQTKDAITAFEQCLTMRTNDDAVYFALSQLYLLDNNLVKSGESIQKAAKLDPNNTHYTSELAYFYVEQQKYGLAVKEFEKLVKIDPRNPEYLYPYAECLVRDGKPEEAIKALTKTEEQMGLFPEITLQKFQLYQQINQTEKGLAEIAKARLQYPEDPQLLSGLVDYYLTNKQDDKAIETLETLAKTDDANGRVHLFLADMYRRKGDKDKFYISAKKAIENQGVDVDTKTQFLSSLQEGGKKISAKDLELAEAFAAAHPTEAKPFSVQGDFYLSNGNEKEALVNYRKALSFEKSASSLWNQVLLMEYQASMYDELAEDSKESLKYFPTLPTFYLLNGVANIQLKKFDEAITNLDIGREFITSDNAMKAEFYGQLGEAYFGKKDFKKGNTWYEKAMEIDPNSSLLMNNYAYRLAVAKIDLSKAEILIKTAISRSPNQPNFIDTYGYILFQKEDYAGAMKQFEIAYGLDNKDKVTAEHLGDAYIKLGKTQEAQKYWAKAKELGSTSKLLDKKIANSTFYEKE
jgi:tetratricopeptide (TPR) repeat protein